METTQSPPAPPPAKTCLDFVPVLARWVLGGIFVYMGVSKALHPEDFLKLARDYQMVANPYILNTLAATLPWFEIFCGLLLLVGVAVRGAALVSLAMLAPFTLIILKRALGLMATQGLSFCAIKFDCGCGSGEVVICTKLIENCALMFVTAWLISGKGKPLSLRYSVVP
jgi:uncharacterized membrane protein YphA (DoxX/SURF4 family)